MSDRPGRRGVRALARRLIPMMDLVAAPAVYPAAALLWAVRRIGVGRMPRSRRVLERVGVFPIRDHYYEPLFKTEHLRPTAGRPRSLPGLDMNVAGQLALLREFRFAEELARFPMERKAEGLFFYRNGSFESGDADYLYSVMRHFKPRRVVEIGGGFSTLLISAALSSNASETGTPRAEHVCIEPYENPWLDGLAVRMIRTPVERTDKSLYDSLAANDVLFIDSSHVVRPGGDVLFECLEVLPRLAPGVLVHFHDIYTPRDYPIGALCDEVIFWNEQYLLEAFLCFNRDYEVIGALNFLAHEHQGELASRFPVYAQGSAEREPGSFWIRRTT